MKRLLASALVVLLAACSSNDEINLEPAELVDIDSSVKLKRLWSEGVGSGAGKHYTLMPTAILGSSIYAANVDGRVIAFSLDKGRELWDIDLETPISSGVGAAQSKVFVGTTNAEVIALDAESGNEIWRTSLTGEVLSPPQSNGRVVAVQTQDGKIFGLNSEDGSQVWMYDNAIPALTLRGTATPVITDTAVYAGFASGKIIALDVKDGTLLWDQRVALAQGRSELERVVDINGAPLLVGDILYSSSYQGRLVAINRGTGRGLWAKKESSYNNMAAANGNIYVSTEGDFVRAYNANSGQLMWENDQLQRRRIGAPQTFGSYVAVADFEGYVHIMNQSDGQFVARRKIDGDGVRSPLQAANDVLFVYGNGGDLDALKVQ